jgi:Asp-tRNA(Asn)/Glu-tRNA(Gln) amidotransferase A subunit family amidase
MCAGLWQHHGTDFLSQGDLLSPGLQELFSVGRRVSADCLQQACYAKFKYQEHLSNVINLQQGSIASEQCMPVFLTLATHHSAPERGFGTGSPLFCMLWSLCGWPAVALPFGHCAQGLPLAVQLVGLPGTDWQLLQTAEWLSSVLGSVCPAPRAIASHDGELASFAEMELHNDI